MFAIVILLDYSENVFNDKHKEQTKGNNWGTDNIFLHLSIILFKCNYYLVFVTCFLYSYNIIMKNINDIRF